MNAKQRLGALTSVLLLLVVWGWWLHGPLPLQLEIWRILKDEDIPGVAVALYRGESGVRAFELGTLADRETPVHRETRLPIASLSKPITAAAIRRLIANGRLHLDDRLGSVLPEQAQLTHSPRGDVSVRNLLQHTAGMSGVIAEDPLFTSNGSVGCRQAMQIESTRAGWAAGTRSIYSNVGYCLLGDMLERRTGERYDDAVRGLLKWGAAESPLTLGMPSALPGGVAVHASWAAPNYIALGPVGGWFSDASTLARVLAATAMAGPDFDAIVMPAPAVDSKPYHYGLGWRVYPDQPNILAHYGLLPGTFAIAVVVRDQGTAVALFSGSSLGAERITQRLMTLFAAALMR